MHTIFSCIHKRRHKHTRTLRGKNIGTSERTSTTTSTARLCESGSYNVNSRTYDVTVSKR